MGFFLLKVAKRYYVQYFIITKLKVSILDSVTKKEDFLNYKISNKEKKSNRKRTKTGILLKNYNVLYVFKDIFLYLQLQPQIPL